MALTELIHLKDDPLQYYASTRQLSFDSPTLSVNDLRVHIRTAELVQPHCKDAGIPLSMWLKSVEARSFVAFHCRSPTLKDSRSHCS